MNTTAPGADITMEPPNWPDDTDMGQLLAEVRRLRARLAAVLTLPEVPSVSHLSPPLDTPSDYERGWAAAMAAVQTTAAVTR